MQSASQYFPCPSFKERERTKKEFAKPWESTEPKGTCDFIKYLQADGTTPGSCMHNGNADVCLRAHTDISEKLRTKLESHIESLESRTEYFKEVLKKSAYFPLRTLSPVELVKNGMNRLAEYEGEAEIIVVQDGKIQSPLKVNLKKLNPRDGWLSFDEGKSSIPLLGVGIAVQRVIGEKGNVLYVNTEVDETYCSNTFDDIREKCGFKSLFT